LPSKKIGANNRLMLGTGFCGAFTTFSTYSVDVVSMINAKKYHLAASYVLATNVGSISAAGLGYYIVSRRFR